MSPENTLSSPMAAGLLMQLKAECEAQHTRAEQAEAEVAALRSRITSMEDDLALEQARTEEAQRQAEQYFAELAALREVVRHLIVEWRHESHRMDDEAHFAVRKCADEIEAVLTGGGVRDVGTPNVHEHEERSKS